MTCQNTTYLSHKIGPDLIIRGKHLNVTCSVNALYFPINVPSPVTSFSLGFQLMKFLEDMLFFFVPPVSCPSVLMQTPSHMRSEEYWC